MKKLMMMAAAVAVAFGAWADTETVGGYTWTYHINGDTAEIEGDDDFLSVVTGIINDLKRIAAEAKHRGGDEPEPEPTPEPTPEPEA